MSTKPPEEFLQQLRTDAEYLEKRDAGRKRFADTSKAEQGAAPRAYYREVTGRFKLYDASGEQFATADDKDSAARIIKVLNAHDGLVDVLVEISGNYGEPVSARKATRALAALTEQTK